MNKNTISMVIFAIMIVAFVIYVMLSLFSNTAYEIPTEQIYIQSGSTVPEEQMEFNSLGAALSAGILLAGCGLIIATVMYYREKKRDEQKRKASREQALYEFLRTR